MEMPKPTTAHHQLAALVGTWVGEEKMYPSPWDPAGGTATGRFQNRLALDGLAVVQTPNLFRGRFEDNTLTMVSASSQGQVRATFELLPPDRDRYRMEVSGDGKTWTRMMDGAYRKQG